MQSHKLPETQHTRTDVRGVSLGFAGPVSSRDSQFQNRPSARKRCGNDPEPETHLEPTTGVRVPNVAVLFCNAVFSQMHFIVTSPSDSIELPR